MSKDEEARKMAKQIWKERIFKNENLINEIKIQWTH